jgi:hypothetical protein
MKSKLLHLLLLPLLFAACTGSYQATNNNDDLYYNPKDEQLAKAQQQLVQKDAQISALETVCQNLRTIKMQIS